jgi:hypothetical protein
VSVPSALEEAPVRRSEDIHLQPLALESPELEESVVQHGGNKRGPMSISAAGGMGLAAIWEGG